MMETGSPQREKRIPRVFAQLMETVDRLDKSISIHIESLSPILQPLPPEKDKLEGGRVREQMPPLANQLADIEERLFSLNNRLQFVQGRLEV